VLSGFTQEMPAITPAMLAAAKADIAAHQAVEELQKKLLLIMFMKVNEVISNTVKSQKAATISVDDHKTEHNHQLQQSQDLLSADLGAFFNDDDFPVLEQPTPVIAPQHATPKVIEPVPQTVTLPKEIVAEKVTPQVTPQKVHTPDKPIIEKAQVIEEVKEAKEVIAHLESVDAAFCRGVRANS
jgi:hypothetical protein